VITQGEKPISSTPDQSGDPAHSDGPPTLPRWVKLLAVATVVAVVVLILAMLLMGGEHGPGLHGG